MKHTALAHPKFSALVKALSLKRFEAVGILESIWLLTANYADDGNLAKFTSEDIALFVEWDRDPDELIAALVKCRWLDLVDGSLHVHGWFDHMPTYLHERHKKRRQRAQLEPVPSAAPSPIVRDIPGQSGTVPDCPGKSDPTQPNHTQPNPTKKKKSASVSETGPTPPPELMEWIDWWNRMRAKDFVNAAVCINPSTDLWKAWGKYSKSPEQQELLADRDKIEALIQQSQDFLKNTLWFTLDGLLFGKNKKGEFYARNLVAGMYTDAKPKKTVAQNTAADFKENSEDTEAQWQRY